MLKRIHGYSHLKDTNELLTARTVVSFGWAIITVSTSIYLRQIGLTDSQVGLVAGLISGLALLASPLIPIVLEKFKTLNVYIISTAAVAILTAIMGRVESLLVGTTMYFLARICLQILSGSASITFKDVASKDSDYTRAQGLASSLMNFGWAFGPFVGGVLLTEYGVVGPFTAGPIIMVLAVMLLMAAPIKVKSKQRRKLDKNWLDNIRFFIKRPGLLRAYAVRMGVSAWWGFVWTFVPLYLLDAGYSPTSVGIITGLTQVPLFLLEFRIVQHIKPLGFHRVFVGSFCLLALTMFSIFAVGSLEFMIVALIVASVIVAFLEPGSEIFFYHLVSSTQEEKAYPIYQTASSTGGLVAKVGVGAVIGLLSARYGYLFMGLMMSLVVVSSLGISRSRLRA